MPDSSQYPEGWVRAVEDIREHHRNRGNLYWEMLRIPPMSVGFYALARRGLDPQSPHQQDEIYVVLRGRAQITIAGHSHAVAPGTVAFVPARVEHRFHSIEEPLELLVVFAPAESDQTEGPGSPEPR